DKHGSRRALEQGKHFISLCDFNRPHTVYFNNRLTEIRVLYELMYILNNSFRANKTFKGLQQFSHVSLSLTDSCFRLAKQQMKWEEFLVLNLVITSMLSRLWVFFCGLLVSLTNLYQQLLKLLEAVAQAQPMPYLTDMVLPADMTEFLGPSDAFMLKKHPAFHAYLKDQKAEPQTWKKASAKFTNKKRMIIVKEDLGVSVERGT
ncbi:hypothetical protein GOODEAATRI_010712, partial [Goodea atripinnis]